MAGEAAEGRTIWRLTGRDGLGFLQGVVSNDVTALARRPGMVWAALRVELMVPEYPEDLIPDDSYLLEMGFERLHGVDFRKGCYVGQEVTARMKHKTDLRKGLVRLRLEGPAEPGTALTLPDGREAGRLGTVAGGRALAHLRMDRAEGPLRAGATVARFDAAGFP
jgi:folate-binding protein YgfZ